MTPKELDRLRHDAAAEPDNACLQALLIKQEIRAGKRSPKDGIRHRLVRLVSLSAHPGSIHIVWFPLRPLDGPFAGEEAYHTYCEGTYSGPIVLSTGKRSESNCSRCKAAFFAERISMLRRARFGGEEETHGP